MISWCMEDGHRICVQLQSALEIEFFLLCLFLPSSFFPAFLQFYIKFRWYPRVVCDICSWNIWLSLRYQSLSNDMSKNQINSKLYESYHFKCMRCSNQTHCSWMFTGFNIYFDIHKLHLFNRETMTNANNFVYLKENMEKGTFLVVGVWRDKMAQLGFWTWIYRIRDNDPIKTVEKSIQIHFICR